ncbi:septum formation initiator family protein [Bacillus sp. HNG]|uniref:FtsB family cell division protein n=1 Tax=Bacillaceae TaxID=186817 RepID=UPI000E2F4ECD|nr:MULTISPECIES: septum formation initiator family protein [Bacillaceae]MDR4888519.1 septum formation initiator family protein [Fredinandcohnia sp. QZ13]RFB10942.1 septum formation initiator family protein [Bacillus sp. HNG]
MSAVRKKNVTQLQSTYMEKYKQQEEAIQIKRKGLIRRLIAFFVLVVIISYGLISMVVSQHKTMNEKAAKKEQLQEQLTALKDEQVLLEEEVVKLNSDEYIEKIIRRDYFLSKEGEIIFKVGDGS